MRERVPAPAAEIAWHAGARARGYIARGPAVAAGVPGTAQIEAQGGCMRRFDVRARVRERDYAGHPVAALGEERTLDARRAGGFEF